MVSDIISIIANIALALSVVVALVFGIAQVRQAASDRRERLTLDALRNFQSREFAELIHYVTFSDMPRPERSCARFPTRIRSPSSRLRRRWNRSA